MNDIILSDIVGFDWNKANKNKNQEKHGALYWECEQLFFNQPLLLYNDINHSHTEKKAYALGKTDKNRKLFIAFTLRNQLIRVISARDMSKNERKIYEQA